MQYRRTALVSNSFLNAGPRYWDSLPDNMKEVHSIDHFKYLHKKYIVRTMSLPYMKVVSSYCDCYLYVYFFFVILHV